MARILKNSKIVPDTGNRPADTGDAAQRGNAIEEAFKGAAGGRTAAERAAARRALIDGPKKAR